MKRRYIIAVTGASGAGYAGALADALADALARITADVVPTDSAPDNSTDERTFEFRLILSANGEKVLAEESSLAPSDLALRLGSRGASVFIDSVDDFSAPPASGSFAWEAMIVVPCSMGTLADIASGSSRNLIARAADVSLKEGRKLVLVPRETPLSLIHLRNMTALAEAGAIILPASPGFYHDPESIDDCYAFIANRIIARLGLPSDAREWGDHG